MVPVGITLWVILKIIINVGSIIEYLNISIHPLLDPVLGVIIVITGLIIIGGVGSSIIFKPLFGLLDGYIEKAPLIKTIYTSLKDLMSAFVGQKKRFNKPVLVTVNESPMMQKLGFITNEDLHDLGISDDRIAVYLPLSYAFSGNLYIISKKNIIPVQASSAEMMKFIISGGVTDID
jgi:uncharacterized membrane protein